MVATLKANGIDAAITVQEDKPLRKLSDDPEMIGVVGWIDLRAKLPPKVAEFKEHPKLVGFGHVKASLIQGLWQIHHSWLTMPRSK